MSHIDTNITLSHPKISRVVMHRSFRCLPFEHPAYRLFTFSSAFGRLSAFCPSKSLFSRRYHCFEFRIERSHFFTHMIDDWLILDSPTANTPIGHSERPKTICFQDLTQSVLEASININHDGDNLRPFEDLHCTHLAAKSGARTFLIGRTVRSCSPAFQNGGAVTTLDQYTDQSQANEVKIRSGRGGEIGRIIKEGCKGEGVCTASTGLGDPTSNITKWFGGEVPNRTTTGQRWLCNMLRRGIKEETDGANICVCAEDCEGTDEPEEDGGKGKHSRPVTRDMRYLTTLSSVRSCRYTLRCVTLISSSSIELSHSRRVHTWY